MGILLGDMLVRYRADITDLTAKSAIASAEVESTGAAGLSGGAMLAGGLAIGAAAVIGLAVVSTKMAADYQQAMNKVQALTGSTNAQMAQYDAGVKDLAVNAGVAPKKLADGLYQVLSAGYQGKTAMDVLKLSVEDAKIGMTDQATTANALTTVLKAFSVPVKDITRVNGEMLETVTLGKMTMTDYAGSVGKASSTAMQFHVSMENMNASIATMTANGIPSAHQAVTDFNQGLSVMYGNIGTVTKSLQKNGIAFDEAKFNTLDYSGKIKMMAQALDEASAKHVKITGVTKQAAAEIQILSQHSGEFHKNLDTLSNKQSMAQKTAQAWAITQGGLNQSMDRLRAAGDVLFITIGQQLLPVFTKIVTAITPIVTAFTGWLAKSNLIVPILAVAAVVIGVTMVAAFIAMAAAAWTAAAGVIAATWPFILIGIAVVAVVAIIILAVKNWGAIMHWFQGVWGAITGWIGTQFSRLGGFLHGIIDAIGGAFSGLGSKLHGIWDGIVGIIKGAINLIIGAINQFIDFIDGIQIHIPSIGIGPIQTPSFNWNGLGIPHIPLLEQGGFIQSSGFAFVHAGETVVPQAATTTPLSNSRGGDTHVHVYLDSVEISHQVMSSADAQVRARYGPYARIVS